MPRELDVQTVASLLAAIICGMPLVTCAAVGLRMLLGHDLSERTTATLARVPTLVTWLTSLALAVSYQWLGRGRPLSLDYGAWFQVAGHEFRVTLLVDALALTMLLMSTSITALVGRFSVRYLHREPGFHRFFLLMSLFSSGMSLLVLAGSYDLLIAGWEMVGIASMLLIAFFNTRTGPVTGALRAMVNYRVVDVGLLSAGVLLHDYLGSAEFSVAFHGGSWPHPGSSLPAEGATLVVLALLLAVMGKSAQFPLSGWLPRAMEGPTPSSALFYGALSIHAGVYLLLRSAPLIESSRVGSLAIGVVGALSALSATLIGRTQSDAKTSLAYATITQVGLMLVGIALHLWVWVVLHMVAHACLRLLQLLRTPSALHDALALHAALRGRPKPRPFFAKRWLSPAALEKLYFLARQRFFIEAWVYRLIVAPFVYIGRACDVIEQAVFLNDGAEPDAARRQLTSVYSARIVSVICLGLSLGLSAHCLFTQPISIVAGVLVIDEVSALYIPLAILVGCITLFVAPAPELTARSLSSLGVALLGSVIAFAAQTMGMFILGWFVSLSGIGLALPPRAKLRATYLLYVGIGGLPLMAAWFVLAPAHVGSFGDAPLLANGALSQGAQHAAFALLAMAAAFRSGLFPFHSWLPALCQRAPVAASSLLFGAQLGPVLVTRALGLFAPALVAQHLANLATWALGSAVFTALLALVQRDIKRSLGFVLSSQSALLLFGLYDGSLSARHGALLGALAVGLTGGGLLLIAALLCDRERTSEIAALHGRGLCYPRLTALYFLFALATIGLPGSLHFVAEDLLLHGILHVSPRLAVVLLLVSVLNGVAVLRLFFTVFQGPARAPHTAQALDLPMRPATILLGLVLTTMLAGLAPSWLLRLQERSLQAHEAHHAAAFALAAD